MTARSLAWRGQRAREVAKAFGAKAAIAALEQGEDKGLADYGRDGLSPTVRTFVERELAPEQRRTREAIARLRERS